MKKILAKLFFISLFFFFISCASTSNPLNIRRIERLELGMSQKEVAKILLNKHNIAEKFIDKGDTIEVFSIKDIYAINEYYMFKFKNNQLESWNRIFRPIYQEVREVKEN